MNLATQLRRRGACIPTALLVSAASVLAFVGDARSELGAETAPEPVYGSSAVDQSPAVAFARLAGSAPIPASSGQVVRHRLDRGGDRQLNRALHTIVVSRRKHHAQTIAYVARRQREGKSVREAIRGVDPLSLTP